MSCLRISLPGWCTIYSYGPNKIFSFSVDHIPSVLLITVLVQIVDSSGQAPIGDLGDKGLEFDLLDDDAIHSSSGTGFRIVARAGGGYVAPFVTPVELVRGGIGFGDESSSGMDVDSWGTARKLLYDYRE